VIFIFNKISNEAVLIDSDSALLKQVNCAKKLSMVDETAALVKAV